MSVELLKAIDKNVRTTFKEARDKTVDKLKGKIYDITKVTGRKANIVTLTDVPGMREFKSERVPGAISTIAQSLAPRKWEQTLAIKREDIEDDELGYVPKVTRRMGVKSKKHYPALIAAAIAQGFTTAMEDGYNFISDEHKNLATGALTAANLNAAELLMLEQEQADGDRQEFMPTILLVGPKNKAAAETIIKAKQIEGTDNVKYDAYELIVDSRIRDLSWFLIDGDEGIYPVTIAERIPTKGLVAKNDLNSDKAFDEDIYEWGDRGRYDPAYENYQLIVGSIGS
jgi:phage major head subunit gpT-like protein